MNGNGLGRGTMSPIWQGRLAVTSQQAARFHRDSDRRLRRAMAAGLVCSAMLVGGVLGVVGLKVQQVRLSYRLDALRAARAATEELNRRLLVELATLTSLARIESKARAELGMVAPARDQVMLAREFVPGGSGLSASQQRVAAAPRPGPAARRVR